MWHFYHISPLTSTPHRSSLCPPLPTHLSLSYGDFWDRKNANSYAIEQVAIEVTASVAQSEPDPYLAQVFRFGLLEDFDHMYRYAALMDRVEGKDANTCGGAKT